ncbi:methyltransferase-like protein 27 isoform X2 [Brevipalpus obovatus]|uniref:methyltransferase-like protein 27 isoform X2 n=2 Tax=Brevipalpus obovatus TaxID=246614 RepID=UPI003D9DF2CD
MDSNDTLQKFNRQSQTPLSSEECRKLYTDWSSDYEKTLNDEGYHPQRSIVKYFDELSLPKNSRILDCGAGTGLVGQELTNRGYTNIDCVDGCEKMLEIARKKNIYKKMYCSFVYPDRELPIESETYDALIMVGVFCPGHFPIEVGTFKQLLRLLKKGGVMVWGMRHPDVYGKVDEAFANRRFDNILQTLSETKIASLMDGCPRMYPNHRGEEEGYFYALKKH